MENYASGQRSYAEFATKTGRSGLPSSIESLLGYLTWGVNIKIPPLDSTTLDTYISAISAFHQHTLEVAQNLAPGLTNPADDPQVRALLGTLLKHHKRASRAKRPLTWEETLGIIERGFDLTTAGGLHCRLLWMLCTLGMLRRGAANALRISYDVCWRDGTLHFIFHKNSDISICRSEETGREYILISVLSDKNVNSRKRVFAVIPDSIPALGISPVEILKHYLHVISPPSLHLALPPRGPTPKAASRSCKRPAHEDGLLLSWPQFRDPQSTGSRPFLRNRYTAASTAFQRMYARAFPMSTSEMLDTIGSHSGRRTMAEFIWACSNHDVRVVADMGHWAILRGAVEKYFSTCTEEKLWLLYHLKNPATRRVYVQYD